VKLWLHQVRLRLAAVWEPTSDGKAQANSCNISPRTNQIYLKLFRNCRYAVHKSISQKEFADEQLQ